jgi:hypothetical protein
VKNLKREKAKMTRKNYIARKISLLIFTLFLFAPFSFLSAQTVEAERKIVVSPIKQKSKTVSGGNDQPTEKSIAVDGKVNISLCVSEGKLKVNGWERNEIRAFVGGGSQVGFRVQQKGGQNGMPVWVMVLGFDPAKNNENGADECLSGDEIELDVPRGATVNVKGSESETMIDSVRKATVLIEGGDIFLNNIAQGIEARTFEGGVTVENSSGAITLISTTGNIVAFAVGASEIGDVFKAKTNSGAIALLQIRHRQIEVGSNSGSIKFTGEFQSGGQYNLGTQNGSISLLLPEKSSFKLNASYGFGVFNSEIPLQNLEKNPTPKAQNLSARVGNGDATLILKTVSGAIRIRKQ